MAAKAECALPVPSKAPERELMSTATLSSTLARFDGSVSALTDFEPPENV